MSSPVQTMEKTFPRCPICKSAKGYEPSPFYPNVTCKDCNAELLLNQNGMELKRASKLKWDEELLNKQYPIEFWKRLKAPEFQIVEKIFAPMDYVGGNPYYRNPVIGYVRLRSDGLTYKASEGSVHQMEVNIAPKMLAALEVIKSADVTSVLGKKTLLIDTNGQYLLVKYKDPAGRRRQLILDFHGLQQNVDELIALAIQLKEKTIKPKKRRARKTTPRILLNIAKARAANTRVNR
jgi:hypothetical protein